jgi:hypothetical protein
LGFCVCFLFLTTTRRHNGTAGVIDWAFVCAFCFSQRHDDTTVQLVWLIGLLCVFFVSTCDKSKLDIRCVVVRNFFRRTVVSSCRCEKLFSSYRRVVVSL